MNTNNPRAALLAATILVLAPIASEATVSRAIKFEDKVDHAASIVVGKCVRQQAQWDAEHNWILTYSTFRVEKSLKGAPAQEITIVTPGGRVGNVAQDVVGMPRFRDGDEHVLFVRNTKAGPAVLYFEQGAYRVVSERGERMVQPQMTASAVRIDTQRGVAEAPEEVRSLRDFEKRVRETIRQREMARMQMTARRTSPDASIGGILRRHWLLVALAIAGAILATWQLYKRW